MNNTKVIETGSCRFHIIHNAFKESAKATTWNIQGLFQCALLLFKSLPARQADFKSVNRPAVAFPAKFCGYWWVENGPVS